MADWKKWFTPGYKHAILGGGMLAFARSEYSSENLLCWLAIEEYNGRRVTIPVCPTGGQRQKLIFIYCTFLQDRAAMEVNTSKAKREAVERALQNSHHDARSALSEIQRDCAMNITDTESRFRFSPWYVAHMESYDLKATTLLKRGLKKLDVLNFQKQFRSLKK
jgi:hypothetical protein